MDQKMYLLKILLKRGPEEMSWKSRALSVPAKDSASVPRTHIAAHTVTLVPGYLNPISDLYVHQACMWCPHIHSSKNSNT